MCATPARGVPFVCSWSGGKDSCLALYRAIQAGAKPIFLLSMLREDGARSRSHGLVPGVLEAQEASLGISLLTRTASWATYESVFVAALRELRASGVEAGVFGDIDIAEHRLWEEQVCAAAGLEAHLPLWQADRLALVDEFLSLGFEALIVVANAEKLGQAYLGRALGRDLVREFARMGVDPSGEEGEYHTVVTNGPIFSEPVQLETGRQVLHSGYWFLDVRVKRKA